MGSCHFGGACFGRPSLGIRLDDVDPNFGDCEQIRALKAGIVLSFGWDIARML